MEISKTFSQNVPSIIALVPGPIPAARPLRSPRSALGGTLPASVLVFPVMEPTMTILGLADPLLALGAFSRSSSSSLQRRKWPRWLVPTDSSKPSAVKRGSLTVGR